MLKISEHFEYYEKGDHFNKFKEVIQWEEHYKSSEFKDELFFLGNEKRKCVSISLKKSESGNEPHFCEINSSYYIGLDRFTNLDLTVYVGPKLNKGILKVDYIKMLLEALKEPENFNHLEGLIETKFDDEWIEIDSNLQPLLTPFLLAQFLAVVKRIVKKGLKLAYYTKTENLSNRIKGKILVGEQVKRNIVKNRVLNTVCQFQEFGVDTEVNQFLKFVLSQVGVHLDEFLNSLDIYKNLMEHLNYCKGGFQQVKHKSFSKSNYKESNPFFKDYNLAIKLGNQILSIKDYNISKSIQKGTIKHPPFWIDMSKLFELYVFKKLKDRFPIEGNVKYHEEHSGQELDFIINTENIKAVVDAKYKPRYKSGNPLLDDARQLAGYTRLNSVYKELSIDNDVIIPTYFIYPSNLKNISDKDETYNNFKVVDRLVNERSILETSFRESTTYRKMYLQEVELPV